MKMELGEGEGVGVEEGFGGGKCEGRKGVRQKRKPYFLCIVGWLETEELEGEAVKVGEGGGMEDEREGGTVKATTGRC